MKLLSAALDKAEGTQIEHCMHHQIGAELTAYILSLADFFKKQ